MNESDRLRHKHTTIDEALATLEKACAPLVDVFLYACTTSSYTSVRGILSDCDCEAPAVTSADWTAVPSELNPQKLRRLEALHIGDTLHVVVNSPVAGALYLFNLGTTGDIIPMHPQEARPANPIEARRAYIVSPIGESSQFWAEADSHPWREEGPCTGYPEQVLAIVTKGVRAVRPQDLHPRWGDQPTRGGGFGHPMVYDLICNWPKGEWVWGLCSAKVER